jgi:homoserine kinase
MGPGFDVLAVALALHVEVSVEPADSLQVVASGEGADLACGAEHLAAHVAIGVAGHDRLRIEVDSAIPVGRGLGSSAALAVAAAAAAGDPNPFAWGVRIDGHPENAAASAFGGLVAATMVGDEPVWCHLALDPDLVFVALVPDRELLTAAARQALPDQISRDDAIFNLGRMGLLIAGLADRRLLIEQAGDDRLHQDARSALFTVAPAILAGLRQAGALTSFWSGAGSTLLAVCERQGAPAIEEAGRRLFEHHGVAGRVLSIEADRVGITHVGLSGL